MTERQKCLSAFQRMRVIQESKNGYAKCITCGRILPVSELDGGHYIGRRHTCTELEMDNVQPQCRKCNRFLSGDAVVYRVNLIKKIGQERVERLENMLSASQGSEEALKNLLKTDGIKAIRKMSESDYAILAKLYRKKTREMKKCKM